MGALENFTLEITLETIVNSICCNIFAYFQLKELKYFLFSRYEKAIEFYIIIMGEITRLGIL